MKQKNRNAVIKMIPIDQINVLNPRVRSQKVFIDIAENITKVGLKRPITVTKNHSGATGMDYDLVCGQGRVEAFQACGQTHIPAIVIDASEEEALIMSLVENLARKQHRSLDLLHGIEVLQQKGYDATAIAKKTGLTYNYAKAVLDLLERGEERLLAAVEAGHIPVSVAASIVNFPNDEQRALQEAYENNELRGAKLKIAKRLLEVRKQRGKSIRQQKHKGGKTRNAGAVSTQDVLKIYQKEVDRKRLITRKANMVHNRILFVTEALHRLYGEDHFVTLLKAEGLMTLPKQLSELLESKR
jgi:ParB family transcriptional regulator, chromosome partitioning protein